MKLRGERLTSHLWQRREPELTGSHVSDHLIVGLASVIAGLLVAWPFVDISLGGDHYVYLARAFTKGTLNVDGMPGFYGDYVPWEGHKYLPFGPLPALLLVPLLPLAKGGLAILVAGYLLTMANVVLAGRLLRLVAIDGERRYWLLLLYFGGTMYLSVALVGISTFLAHIVTTTFLLLALCEFFGGRRLVLVGLFIGLATAARATALFSIPFFSLMLWRSLPAGDAISETSGSVSFGRLRHAVTGLTYISLGLALPAVLLFGYNYGRFGSFLETGFGRAVLYTDVLEKARAQGLFSFVHVPKNLFMMLLQGPIPVGGDTAAVLRPPFVEPSPWGMGLFFTSPALVFIFRAPFRADLVKACWAAILCTLVPILAYYGIGFVQFGYRYALDFMPFLVLLVGLGLAQRPSRTARILIAASVVINVWGAIWLAVNL